MESQPGVRTAPAAAVFSGILITTFQSDSKLLRGHVYNFGPLLFCPIDNKILFHYPSLAWKHKTNRLRKDKYVEVEFILVFSTKHEKYLLIYQNYFDENVSTKRKYVL